MSNWEKQYEVLANTLTDKGFDVPGILKKLSEQLVELPSWGCWPSLGQASPNSPDSSFF